jgi:hypothetical protein
MACKTFFVETTIKIILGLFWIMTGVITGVFTSERGLKIIIELGFSEQIAQVMLYSSCLADIILGTLMIIKPRIIGVCILQILLMLAYTFFLTLLKPDLWLEPLGSLTKNIPIILLTLVLLAIEKDK